MAPTAVFVIFAPIETDMPEREQMDLEEQPVCNWLVN